MAVSLVASQAKSLGIDAYRPAAIRAGELLQQWSSLALPPRCMLNVNVPEGPLTSHKGFATTRLGHRNPSPPVLKLRDPRGQDAYWIGPSGEPSDDADGTDFHAIKEGFISVTALDSDMTCRRSSAMLGQWLAKVGAV
jgi:5'-nucleotidase